MLNGGEKIDRKKQHVLTCSVIKLAHPIGSKIDRDGEKKAKNTMILLPLSYDVFKSLVGIVICFEY